MQKNKSHVGVSLGAIVVSLALSNAALPATITVDATAQESPQQNNGNCTLAEAMTAANSDSAVDNCTPGNGTDTITLPDHATITLTVVDNTVKGPSGLPAVTSHIIITGNHAIIARTADANAAAFRLFFVETTGQLELSDLTLQHGNAGTNEDGGAVAAHGSLSMQRCVVSDNTAHAGGGVVIDSATNDATVALTDMILEKNTATSVGGGLYQSGGNLTMLRSTIRDNNAQFGAGMYSHSTNHRVFERLAITGNKSSVINGGLFLDAGTVDVVNTTITQNEASLLSGGLLISGAATTLRNSTIANNTAPNGGAGVYDQGNSVITLGNTIVAANVSNSAVNPDCNTTFTSLGHNIFGVSNGCQGHLDSDFINVDPQLAPFVGNDAPGGSHLPLGTNSVAIDAGDVSACVASAASDLSVDQLGKSRYGPCDIGAFEFGTCGDGFLQSTVESCDDGNNINTDACPNTCQLPSCGDGIVQNSEQCDDGNQSNTDACLNGCVLATCGDGLVEFGVEACDQGTKNGSKESCTPKCTIATCGDGFVHFAAFEACDDGNTSDNDACLSSCKEAQCGDGFVQTGVEQCDDGNTQDGDSCPHDCIFHTCGDGVVDPGEQCDDGNNSNDDFCLKTCVFASCGDGFVSAGVEACDEGANNSDHGNCTTACNVAVCSDGLVQTGVEECDDGNPDTGDDCTNDCHSNCGNGQLNATEICDDGNTDNTDACLNSCVAAQCGDGFVNAGTETCDDSNTKNDDGCSSTCQKEIVAPPATEPINPAPDAEKPTPPVAPTTPEDESSTTSVDPATPVAVPAIVDSSTTNNTDAIDTPDTTSASAASGGGCTLVRH